MIPNHDLLVGNSSFNLFSNIGSFFATNSHTTTKDNHCQNPCLLMVNHCQSCRFRVITRTWLNPKCQSGRYVIFSESFGRKGPIYRLSIAQRMKVAVGGLMGEINLIHKILFKMITSAAFILSSTDSTLGEYNLCYRSLINISHFLAYIAHFLAYIGHFAQTSATFG